jgi:hypothetical protein
MCGLACLGQCRDGQGEIRADLSLEVIFDLCEALFGNGQSRDYGLSHLGFELEHSVCRRTECVEHSLFGWGWIEWA